MASTFRKHLSAPGLIKTIYHQFCKIPDPRRSTKRDTISLQDHLMSGLAVFGLKCPSLLDYVSSDNYLGRSTTITMAGRGLPKEVVFSA